MVSLSNRPNSEAALPPASWRSGLDLLRAGLAGGGLLLELAAVESSGAAVRSLLGGYLVYSLAVLAARAQPPGQHHPVRLVVDGVYFAVCGFVRSGEAVWLSGMVYLYLLGTAVLLHRRRWALGAVIVPPVLIYAIRPADAARLGPALWAAAVLAAVFTLYRDRLAQALGRALGEAERLRAESERALRQERERIAADFHDGPQQSLVTLHMRLEVLRKLMERDPQAAAEELSRLQELARRQAVEARAFTRSLRPAEPEEAVLREVIARVVTDFESASGIPARLVCEGEVTVDDSTLVRELAQILREALHNIQKHSGASKADVCLRRSQGCLELSVADDGKGFDFAGARALDELEFLGEGPAGIRRRVRGLRGELTLESRPGAGATLTVRVPL